MKRALCLALLGAAALSAVPAHAAEKYDVVITHHEDNGVFVGVGFTRDNGSGPRYTPIGGAGVNTETGAVCAGLSYQVPVCVGPIK